MGTNEVIYPKISQYGREHKKNVPVADWLPLSAAFGEGLVRAHRMSTRFCGTENRSFPELPWFHALCCANVHLCDTTRRLPKPILLGISPRRGSRPLLSDLDIHRLRNRQCGDRRPSHGNAGDLAQRYG